MFHFNPAAAADAALDAAAALKAASGSPAAVARFETANISSGAAVGQADVLTGRLAKAGDQFEIGSQTKMMTATIILQLAGEGKISLDAKIADYLDPAIISGIAQAETSTVRQLLQMTSGIANYTEVLNADGIPVFVANIINNSGIAFGTDDALAITRGQPAAGAPGEFNYSNTNYALLGKIIEASTGAALPGTFKTRIFDPAGMTHSKLEGIATSADGLHNYNLFNGELTETTFAKWDEGAEGGVVSNTADMIRFVKALLMEGKLLAPAQIQDMTSGLLTGAQDQFKAYFGLGLSIIEVEGAGRFFGFTGETLGNLSTTYISERTGAAVSVDINQGNTGASTDLAVFELLKRLSTDPAFAPITSFDARRDALSIDAASASSATVHGGTSTGLAFDAASITLPLALRSVTTSNITFSDGSLLIVGDNRVGTAGDERANTIDILRDHACAANKNNQILGLGGNDRLSGGNGDDRIMGGDGNDRMDGRAGNDALFGEAGNDTLRGGQGHDLLSGGAGHDIFKFASAAEIGKAPGQRDVILDFVQGDDRIDLREIDANTRRHGNQHFSFVGDHAFSGHAGELRFWTPDLDGAGNDQTYVEGDVNGDSIADFRLELSGLHNLGWADFML